jgi:hypothetical protein
MFGSWALFNFHLRRFINKTMFGKWSIIRQIMKLFMPKTIMQVEVVETLNEIARL